MDWPEPLPHMIRGEEIRDSREFVEKPILESEERSGSDNGGLWEYATDDLLSNALRSR